MGRTLVSVRLIGPAGCARKLTKMPHETPTTQRGAVLLPVKDFTAAKGRLADALTPSERAALAKEMATHVVSVQRNVTVAVCCDDEAVAEWAKSTGASVIWCPGTDLNGAVQQGYQELGDAGYRFVAIAHSDLPLATSLDALLGWPGVTLVPDRHRSGTNVMTLPTGLDITFGYGESSLRYHIGEAVRLSRGLRIVHDSGLGWDVDQPDDLTLPS